MDLVSLARSVERHEFVAECPFPLLLSLNEPVDDIAEAYNDEVTTQSFKRSAQPPPTRPVARLVLYPVRKIHSLLPHGIILGRIASTCDVVIEDRHVSKAHALFQESAGHWSLSDIGSHNGTYVNHQRAMPRGAAVPLGFGDIVSFAFRAFYFVDAGGAWDKVRPTK